LKESEETVDKAETENDEKKNLNNVKNQNEIY